MRAAAASSFDVAAWLLARAHRERRRLPPLAMQRLLYLAQAHFAAATGGQRLMPSVFVATTKGPIEPNLARIADFGSPIIAVAKLPKPVTDFLDGIWAAFAALPEARLEAMVMASAPVKAAMSNGPGAVIPEREMAEFHRGKGGGGRVIAATDGAAPPPPLIHRGKPVSKWVPGQKPGQNPGQKPGRKPGQKPGQKPGKG